MKIRVENTMNLLSSFKMVLKIKFHGSDVQNNINPNPREAMISIKKPLLCN
jgi:hypothetical protein